KHDAVTGEAWLHGRLTYMLYRRGGRTGVASPPRRIHSEGRVARGGAERQPDFSRSVDEPPQGHGDAGAGGHKRDLPVKPGAREQGNGTENDGDLKEELAAIVEARAAFRGGNFLAEFFGD